MDVVGNAVLKRKRLEAGYRSVWALAAAAGCSASAIAVAERWGYRPGPAVRAKIAAALGVEEREIWPEANDDGKGSGL